MIPDCMVIYRGYLFLFWLSHSNGADEFEIKVLFLLLKAND